MLDLYRLATALKEVKEPSRQTKWAFSAVIDGSNPPQTAWFSSLLNECPPGLSKLSTVHCAESQLLMSHGARFGVIAIIKAESDLVLGDADPSPDLGLQHQGPISGQCCDWTNQSEARCRVFSSPNKGWRRCNPSKIKKNKRKIHDFESEMWYRVVPRMFPVAVALFARPRDW